MSFDISGYETVSDLTLLYYDYDFSIDYSSYNVDMEGTINVDRENGEITSTIYSSMTGSIETVMEVSDEVSVLSSGKVIAEGTPREVQNDKAVIAVYLGERETENANHTKS